ncbi:MAG: Rrf2 family transcriptional regulator [Rhodopirellula sp.]|nr:Rrf2 family transcriptional regulator [Rhodopirellula sp.]
MLQKTAEYALRAIVYLAQNPDASQSADKVAAVTRIPRRYLHRVLQQMVQAGLVRSQPGPHGGYSLARPAEEIPLIDVINAFGPIDRIRKCPLGLASHTGLCPLHRELDEAYASIEAAFSRVTIAQILDKRSKFIPLCEHC